MIRKSFLLFLLGWLMGFAWPLFAENGIQIKAENILYEEQEGRIEAWGKVLVSWQGVNVQTERLVFLLSELELFVPVPLEATLNGNRVEGSAFYYSFARKEGWVEEAELFYRVGEEGELLFRGQTMRYSRGE